MSGSESQALKTTVLHPWHVANGARMVGFGGWDMPVQYPSGILQEHLATRRHAGLFDVSHMGRLRFAGPRAVDYLLQALTNNLRALRPGQAQYTFIANHDGGAVDDAYLYRLDEEEFLLVVNASNRDADWAWLRALDPPSDLIMEDLSEQMAMISLQGPQAQSILDSLVTGGTLPEPKRNRLATMEIDGRSMIIARTGYTGESVCFELFPQRDDALGLWQTLIDRGAAPVGLGARDSLRLEAGLPLYGHELGAAPDGSEIPIFANDIARFAVRAGDHGDYVGREALERQREEFAAIRRREIDTPVGQRVLQRMVQPIAVFGGRKPLRAGSRVKLDGREIGWVTSGTTVPATRFSDPTLNALPADGHELRPIGLVLIDSDVHYRSHRPVHLDVVDERGREFKVELVERNLWPAAPYARVPSGFAPPTTPARIDPEEIHSRVIALREATDANDRWRRQQCINLIPSEQCTSSLVDRLCTADPAGRYNEHNRLRALGADAPDVRYYKGTAFSMEHEEELKAALRTFFDCTHVEPRVISGQMANDTVYDALMQFHNRLRGAVQPERIRRVLVHDLNKGGHLSAQVQGALRNYVDIDADSGRPAVEHFPFRADDPYAIDVAATCKLIEATRPELIVFGRSVIVQREPVREIAEFVFELFGREDPRRPLIMYDGAHVLGLLGPHFQSPLAEGADIITGSTHKTFFGPQRGVILASIEPGSVFEPLWQSIESRTFPGHVSNHHLGTLLGLLGATYEMLAHRDDYQRQVIANARAFAHALTSRGLAIEGNPAHGYTETHQVLLRGARARGGVLADRLEAAHIITNPQAFHDDPSFAAASGVRMGSQEMTRYGMKEKDFDEIGELIAGVIRDERGSRIDHWRQAVGDLRQRFTEMHYCL